MNWNELKEIALTNPKGKILNMGAKFPDVDNCGAWNKTDYYIDVIQDIMYGLARLNNTPRIMLMHPKTYGDFVGAIGFQTLYEMGAVFGCAPNDRSWLEVRDAYEEDSVIIIARSQSIMAKPNIPDPTVVFIDTR